MNAESQEQIMERAMGMAATCPDTPMDAGFGYEFDTPNTEQTQPIQGFRLSEIITVPYSGDEQPIPRVDRQVDDFMLNKPA